MSSEPLSPSERMSAAFSKLRESAKQIKSASDELTRAVHGIELALERFDLRVACYTLLSEWIGFDQDEFRREYVGYIDVHNQWRIVVQTVEGYSSRPDEESEKTWRFDAAPQYLRIKAIEKLPELIESLVVTVDKTTERLKKKIAPAQELAEAINARPSPPPPKGILATMEAIARATTPPPDPAVMGTLSIKPPTATPDPTMITGRLTMTPQADTPDLRKGKLPVTPRSEKK